MKPSYVVAFACAAIVSFTCVTPSQPGTPGSVSPSIDVVTGKPFDIAVGESARVEGTPLTIQLAGIEQDSRCPQGVQCIWAGNAVARLVVAATGESGTEVRINTRLQPKDVVFRGYRISIAGLKPVPRAGKPIPARDYVATLEVSPE